MKKILIFLMVLMMLPVVFGGGTITRSFPTNPVAGNVQVTLTVTPSGSETFLIEETSPLAITNLPEGCFSSISTVMKCNFFSITTPKTLTYTVNALSSHTYTFSGVYGLGSGGSKQTIGGNTQLAVSESSSTCSGSSSQSCTVGTCAGTQTRICNSGTWSSWGDCAKTDSNCGSSTDDNNDGKDEPFSLDMNKCILKISDTTCLTLMHLLLIFGAIAIWSAIK